MSALTGAAITAVVLLVVIAYLCFRLSRAHLASSRHCQCIADMLRRPDHAEQIANANRDRCIAEGLWRT